jgi:hypothetical protein
MPYNPTAGRHARQEKQRAIDLHFATANSHAPRFGANIAAHSGANRALPNGDRGLTANDFFRRKCLASIDCGRRGDRKFRPRRSAGECVQRSASMLIVLVALIGQPDNR